MSTQFILFFSFSFPDTLHARDQKLRRAKGIIQYNEEMTDFALESFERCLEENPDDDISAAYLGRIWMRRNDHRRALYYFEMSLRLNDSQADIHTNTGEIYDYLARFDKAYSHFSRAVELNGNNTIALIGMARIESLRGNTGESENFFARAYSSADEKSAPYFDAAVIARREKRIKLAVFYCLKTLEANPAHTEAYYELSSIYRSQNDYGKAIAVLEKLKYYQPHLELVYHHIANIYYANRVLKTRKLDLEAAITNINRAIALNPDNLRNWELLEDLYRMTGDDVLREKTRLKIEELINSGAF